MPECVMECKTAMQQVPVTDVVFVRPEQANSLERRRAIIMRLTLQEIDANLRSLVACTSVQAFIDLRKEIFPQYHHLYLGLANLFAMVNAPKRHEAVDRALIMMQRFFEMEGASLLGPEAIRDLIFSLDTLRRAYRLVAMIHQGGSVTEELRDTDARIAREFNAAVMWSQMHVDCLRLIVASKLAVNEEVLGEMLNGSRCALKAYSYARQGLELRIHREPLLQVAMLDVEDRELLEESYLDSESTLDDYFQPESQS